MQQPLSWRILEYYGCPVEKEPQLRKRLDERLSEICKPCWELKYCPYGTLVEEFPLPDYGDKMSKFETAAECAEFGHLCPAFFVSESFTETSDQRKRSRYIPTATILRVVRRDQNTCQICKKVLLDKDIEIDHIIPYSKGGTSAESNLRVTCRECNRKRGNKIEL